MFLCWIGFGPAPGYGVWRDVRKLLTSVGSSDSYDMCGRSQGMGPSHPDVQPTRQSIPYLSCRRSLRCRQYAESSPRSSSILVQASSRTRRSRYQCHPRQNIAATPRRPQSPRSQTRAECRLATPSATHGRKPTSLPTCTRTISNEVPAGCTFPMPLQTSTRTPLAKSPGSYQTVRASCPPPLEIKIKSTIKSKNAM
jgi:hypothetical protein